MVELSSHLKPVQVPQVSTDQYHESSLSPVSNLTRPCFCVHECVCPVGDIFSSTVSRGQFIWTPAGLEGHPRVPWVKSSGNPAYVLRSVNGNSGTPSTHTEDFVSVDHKTGQTDEGSHGPKKKEKRKRKKKTKKKKHPIRLESLQFRIIQKQNK